MIDNNKPKPPQGRTSSGKKTKPIVQRPGYNKRIKGYWRRKDKDRK